MGGDIPAQDLGKPQWSGIHEVPIPGSGWPCSRVMPVLSEEHRSDHSVPDRWGWFLTSLWRVAFCVLGSVPALMSFCRCVSQKPVAVS